MDLSSTSIEEIAEELRRRDLQFALIIAPKDSDGPLREDDEYRIYSSAEANEHCVGEAIRCLIGSLTVLTSLVQQLEDQEDDEAHCFWRWVAVGETLLNDIFRTTEEWSEQS